MIKTRKKVLSLVITAAGLLALFLFAVNTGSLKVSPAAVTLG